MIASKTPLPAQSKGLTAGAAGAVTHLGCGFADAAQYLALDRLGSRG